VTVDLSTQIPEKETTTIPENSRVWAVAAYLLLMIGGALVYLLNRKDPFATFHARQSIRLTVLAILVPAIWTVLAWLIALIPLVGPLVAAASFSLIIAFLLTWIVAWIFGLLNALRGRLKPVPFFGGRTS